MEQNENWMNIFTNNLLIRKNRFYRKTVILYTGREFVYGTEKY